jgi:hypothetical protein
MKRQEMIQEIIEESPATKCLAGDQNLYTWLEMDFDQAEEKDVVYVATEWGYTADVDDRQVDEYSWDELDDSQIKDVHGVIVRQDQGVYRNQK